MLGGTHARLSKRPTVAQTNVGDDEHHDNDSSDIGGFNISRTKSTVYIILGAFSNSYVGTKPSFGAFMSKEKFPADLLGETGMWCLYVEWNIEWGCCV